mmetsp:Transcript_245/g.583  ORF Transcript_245/g.583 Transcript_245/m.583 type:complete len:357 (+) Transcript_245:2228-3298(+)
MRRDNVPAKGRPDLVQHQIDIVEGFGAGQVDAKDPVGPDRRCGTGDIGSLDGILDGPEPVSVLLRVALGGGCFVRSSLAKIAPGHRPEGIDVGIAPGAARGCLPVGREIDRDPPDGSPVSEQRGPSIVVCGRITTIFAVVVAAVFPGSRENGTGRRGGMILRGKRHGRAHHPHAGVASIVGFPRGGPQDVPIGREVVHGRPQKGRSRAAVVQRHKARIGRRCLFVPGRIVVGPAAPRKIRRQRQIDPGFVFSRVGCGCGSCTERRAIGRIVGLRRSVSAIRGCLGMIAGWLRSVLWTVIIVWWKRISRRRWWHWHLNWWIWRWIPRRWRNLGRRPRTWRWHLHLPLHLPLHWRLHR